MTAPADPTRPRLIDEQLVEWEKYALADEEGGKLFLAPPGALLGLIHEVQEARRGVTLPATMLDELMAASHAVLLDASRPRTAVTTDLQGRLISARQAITDWKATR